MTFFNDFPLDFDTVVRGVAVLSLEGFQSSLGSRTSAVPADAKTTLQSGEWGLLVNPLFQRMLLESYFRAQPLLNSPPSVRVR